MIARSPSTSDHVVRRRASEREQGKAAYDRKWKKAARVKDPEKFRAQGRHWWANHRQYVSPEELEACRKDPRKAWTIRGNGLIVCLECGQLAEQLVQHIRVVHRMTTAEYKAKPGPDGLTRRYNKHASLTSVDLQARKSKTYSELRLGRRLLRSGRCRPVEELLAARGPREMSLQYRLDVGDKTRGKARPERWKRTPRGEVVTDVKIARLRLQGKTAARISQLLGLSQNAASVRLRPMGFPLRGACLYEHGAPISGEDVRNLSLDYAETVEEIGRRLHASPSWMGLHRSHSYRSKPLTVTMARRVQKLDRSLLSVYRIKPSSRKGGRPRQLPPSKDRKLCARYKDLLLDLKALRDWLRKQDAPQNFNTIWGWLCEQRRCGQMRTLFFWPQFFEWLETSYETRAFLTGDWIPHELAVQFLAESSRVNEDLILWVLSHKNSSHDISDR